MSEVFIAPGIDLAASYAYSKGNIRGNARPRFHADAAVKDTLFFEHFDDFWVFVC